MSDKESTLVLGIDLGTRPGWCAYDGGVKEIIACGSLDLTLKSWEGAGMRPFRWRRALISIISEMKPGIVVYEDVRRHKATTAAHIYGELRGVLLEVCDTWNPPIPVTAVGVGAWKKAATGVGNASKDDVARWAATVAGWPTEYSLPEDVSDAAGIAVGWARLEL